MYGHGAGDWAIKAASDVIMNHIRLEYDWAARYGGDEFFLCLHNADEKQAHTIMKRIQRDIENIPMDFQIESSHLSISYGIETMRGIPRTAEELIRLSNQKMYQSKREKR